MHADEIDELDDPRWAALQAVAERRGAYDPYAHPTWAAARAAFPYHALICIVDLQERRHFVTPIFPQDDCSDLALDGRVYIVGWTDAAGVALDEEIGAGLLRGFDPGPFTPRR